MKITKSRLRKIIREAVQLHNPGNMTWPAGSRLALLGAPSIKKIIQQKGNNARQALIKLHQMATSPEAWKKISSDKAIMRGVDALTKTAESLGAGELGKRNTGTMNPYGHQAQADMLEDKLRAVVAAMQKLLKTNSEKS